ncbi:unnamed protein product [Bursaphelenchus xylophilus]|uniref:(pine wood nematode) hypothetical protein n=1 Tax=Bursaphelenchus xylophilus TaxID=6326 RepID=A0A1I7SFU5_BURXY|nr:unnamed protein product [Bursaphelenchus xylophilus]CAG9080959.1 unnamed protein product [Bursaphelenchus xylophilus]
MILPRWNLLHILQFSTLFWYCSSIRFPYYSPDAYPDSERDFSLCRMPWRSLVCDPNEILSEEGLLQLDRSTKFILNKTKCPCASYDSPMGYCTKETGYSISIAVLDSIYVESSELVIKERLERIFPEALRRKQSRGQCDDDILIVLAVKNRIVATSVGSVARRKLNYEIVDKVTELAKFRYFDDGDYARGLNLMVEIFGKVLAGENYLEVLPSKVERLYFYKLKNLFPSWPIWLTFLVLVGIPAIVVLIVLITALIISLRKYLRITRYGYQSGNPDEPTDELTETSLTSSLNSS